MRRDPVHGDSPWRSLAMFTALWGALVAGCGAALPPEPGLSFEEFKATVLQSPEGAYVVETDILLHGDDALRAYYESSVAPSHESLSQAPPLAQRESSLAVGLKVISCSTQRMCEPFECLEL